MTAQQKFALAHIPGKKRHLVEATLPMSLPEPPFISIKAEFNCSALEPQLSQGLSKRMRQPSLSSYKNLKINWNSNHVSYFMVDARSVIEALKLNFNTLVRRVRIAYTKIPSSNTSFSCITSVLTLSLCFHFAIHSLILSFIIYWALTNYQLCARRSEAITFPLAFTVLWYSNGNITK